MDGSIGKIEGARDEWRSTAMNGGAPRTVRFSAKYQARIRPPSWPFRLRRCNWPRFVKRCVR